MPIGISLRAQGQREYSLAVARVLGRGFQKEIGQVNKEIGQLVISRLQPSPAPQAVGEGRGKTVRPSTTARDVILRVGGSHRTPFPGQQRPGVRDVWGTRRVGHPREAPARPHIIASAENQQNEIERLLLDGYSRALRPLGRMTV